MLLLSCGQAANQPEIAYLDVTVGIEQKVAGLEVAMDELQFVKMLESLDQLEEDVLLVVDGQDVASG